MKLLEYNIDRAVRAFSTMRGEGAGCYGGFNITHYCGDTPRHTTECRREMCRELGIEESRLIVPRQTHSDKLLVIDEEFLQQPPEAQEKALYGVDAVITSTKGTCIGVSTADCIPVLLFDRERMVAAAIHAGWRGTVAGIVTKCIAQMQEQMGCRPADFSAVIAPGISLEAFEVGDEVYEEFRRSGFDCGRIARRYPTACGGKKWHIDLWEANRLQLLACGVATENIEVAGICTFTRHEKFFSARRLGIESGRIFNGILIR